ncbi:hypothetical protein DM860_015821 [Cuscuta australis]|uniref:Zinc finger CCCH domain-containing protein 1 n=1 Tax=Cuscuta australis TaxID=267555 RepID=A0A328DY61_9ASTE|nr:hypothetical protein DM860_015821 [Cuscuta australis]
MADESDEVNPGDPQSTVCSFFRKPTKSKNIRKRAATEDEENEDSNAETSVVFNKKKPAVADNKLHFSTGPSKRDVTSESDADLKTHTFHFESSGGVQVQNDNRATATLETETEFSKDARAIRERVLKQAEEALKGKDKNPSDEKLYKGIHGYTDYKAGFRREHTISSEKAGGSHGPLRASAYIRVSARFDYQPDICKDYKETGYCGYGDSCKFMHDRGDYKPGWQLEKEWEEAEKAKKRRMEMGMVDDEDEGAEQSDEGEDDDSLPFACFICRKPFVDPVVTKCKHYFCEHCALKHHAKNKKCFVCNEPTLGIFNTAFDIRKKTAAAGGK